VALTHFIANLRCPNCGQTNRGWVSTQLDDQGDSYQVGDRYADLITVADFDAACLTVKRPLPGAAIHAVMSWSCTNCTAASFAEVVFDGGVVTSIAPVELDHDTLARIHYLGTDTEEMLVAIAGQPLYVNSQLVPNWLDLLRAGLAAGRRW
jgi:hypothetical protein